MRKEREKVEIQKQLDELKVVIDQYQAKVNLCQANSAKIQADSEAKKVIELCERTGERKHIHQSLDELASTLLRDRKAYVLSKITKSETTEDEIVENIVVDGACIRTPDEDIIWAEKQKEIEAENAKGGKKAPPKKK